MDRKQHGILHDATAEDGGRIVDLALAHHEGFWKRADSSAAFALTPRHGAHGADRGLHDPLRKLDAHHPIGVGHVQLERRVVAVQGRGELAHLVIALAGHREVADRVDPPAARRLDARAWVDERTNDGAIVAVVEHRKAVEINPARNAVARSDLRGGTRRADHAHDKQQHGGSRQQPTAAARSATGHRKSLLGRASRRSTVIETV